MIRLRPIKGFIDRWLQSKQSILTIGMTMSEEEEGSAVRSEGTKSLAYQTRRFTDYFFLVIRHSNEETEQDVGVETAALYIVEIEGE